MFKRFIQAGMKQFLLISALVIGIGMLLVGCIRGPATQAVGTLISKSSLTQEIQMNQQTDSSEQGSSAPQTIMLGEKPVTRQNVKAELSFPMLWPQYLPADFPLVKMITMAPSGSAVGKINNVVLHYGSGQGHWLIIEETQDILSVQLDEYTLLEQIQVNGQTVPIYEKVRGISGEFTHMYFKVSDVLFFVQAVGLTKDEMLKVAANLQTQQ